MIWLLDLFRRLGNAEILTALENLKGLLMTTQAELAAQITELTAQNDKARAEVLGKIADLEDALNNSTDEVDPAVMEAFGALKSSVQMDDDLVPDAEPVPEEPTP